MFATGIGALQILPVPVLLFGAETEHGPATNDVPFQHLPLFAPEVPVRVKVTLLKSTPLPVSVAVRQTTKSASEQFWRHEPPPLLPVARVDPWAGPKLLSVGPVASVVKFTTTLDAAFPATSTALKVAW